jgi:hypothetical protein
MLIRKKERKKEGRIIKFTQSFYCNFLSIIFLKLFDKKTHVNKNNNNLLVLFILTTLFFKSIVFFPRKKVKKIQQFICKFFHQKMKRKKR